MLMNWCGTNYCGFVCLCVCIMLFPTEIGAFIRSDPLHCSMKTYSYLWIGNFNFTLVLSYVYQYFHFVVAQDNPFIANSYFRKWIQLIWFSDGQHFNVDIVSKKNLDKNF